VGVGVGVFGAPSDQGRHTGLHGTCEGGGVWVWVWVWVCWERLVTWEGTLDYMVRVWVEVGEC